MTANMVLGSILALVLGITLSSSTIYEWFFEIMSKERRMHKPNVIHVSELTQCLLKSYWNRIRVERKIDIKNVIYTIGNGLHKALQDHLAAKGWNAEVELKMKLGPFILVGHADLISPDNEVVEIKTTSKIPEKPYENHLMQLNAYLYMGKARKGYLVYIDKNQGLVKVFKHYRDNRLWGELKQRAYTFWSHLKEKKAPKPERSILCNYCEWKWLCYSKRSK